MPVLSINDKQYNYRLYNLKNKGNGFPRIKFLDRFM